MSFSVTVQMEAPETPVQGVMIAQGDAFGVGRSTPRTQGKARLQPLGIQLFVIEAIEAIPAGKHQVKMEFAYDGGGFGKGGNVRLSCDQPLESVSGSW
jgi:hypothetical protein